MILSKGILLCKYIDIYLEFLYDSDSFLNIHIE